MATARLLLQKCSQKYNTFSLVFADLVDAREMDFSLKRLIQIQRGVSRSIVLAHMYTQHNQHRSLKNDNEVTTSLQQQ